MIFKATVWEKHARPGSPSVKASLLANQIVRTMSSLVASTRTHSAALHNTS
jgi:hypothetical protein